MLSFAGSFFWPKGRCAGARRSRSVWHFTTSNEEGWPEGHPSSCGSTKGLGLVVEPRPSQPPDVAVAVREEVLDARGGAHDALAEHRDADGRIIVGDIRQLDEEVNPLLD